MEFDKEKLIELLDIAKSAGLEAGKEILEICNSKDLGVELKGDNSPLTKADKAAHRIIMGYLENTNIPVLSEEGRDIPFEERRHWDYLWIVDPLDGTKEFIKRNGEFTVNIALVHQGIPMMGVVYAPVLDKLYFGGNGLACKVESTDRSETLSGNTHFDREKSGNRVVASRSHLNAETQEFLDSLLAPEVLSMGSSLKFMLLAEGQADVYPRFAPTMEWDTAAAHAILLGLGISVNDQKNNPLKYNKENLLNPYFCAQLIKNVSR